METSNENLVPSVSSEVTIDSCEVYQHHSDEGDIDASKQEYIILNSAILFEF